MLKKISLITLLVTSAFAMHYGEININNQDLEINAKLDVGQFNTRVEPETMFVGARFINADKDHSSDDAVDAPELEPYFELNLLMMRAVGNLGMSLGMGIKTAITDNYVAIPLGLEFAYAIPAVKIMPMYLRGSLYYAPNVLCMSDADSYLEYRISYDIEVIKNGLISVGYRNIDTNFDDNGAKVDFTYNDSFYVGFKIGF